MVPRGVKRGACDDGRGFRGCRLFVLAKPPIFQVIHPKFDVMTVVNQDKQKTKEISDCSDT